MDLIAPSNPLFIETVLSLLNDIKIFFIGKRESLEIKVGEILYIHLSSLITMKYQGLRERTIENFADDLPSQGPLCGGGFADYFGCDHR